MIEIAFKAPRRVHVRAANPYDAVRRVAGFRFLGLRRSRSFSQALAFTAENAFQRCRAEETVAMWFQEEAGRLSRNAMLELTRRFAQEARRRICAHPKRVLLLPPDTTRAHSGAGWITEELYKLFAGTAEVHVIPTLGQHVPHTPEQNRRMFGAIPEERIGIHDWRAGTRTVGEIPRSFVSEVSGGKADWPIPIALNTTLLDGRWDLILNVGHVVPHEVLGFACRR